MATAYEKVQLARGKGRPSGLSFIQNIFPDFIGAARRPPFCG